LVATEECSKADSIPANSLKYTALDFPDLINTTNAFTIRYADKVESFKVPKLKFIGGFMIVDLSGENPPPINLSFPSLDHVFSGIYLTGNIDA